jgi:hypothetical protein
MPEQTEIAEALEQIQLVLADYAHGSDNPDARAEIETQLRTLDSLLPAGQYKTDSIRSLSRALFSADKWQSRGIARISYFIRKDCAALEVIAARDRYVKSLCQNCSSPFLEDRWSMHVCP